MDTTNQPPPEEIVEIDLDAAGTETQQPDLLAEAKPPEPAPKEISADEGIEQFKRAQVAAEERASAAEQRERAAQQQLAAHGQMARQQEIQQIEGHISVLQANIGKARVEGGALKSQLAAAWREGDYEKAADIQEKISGYQAEIGTYVEGLRNLEWQKQQRGIPTQGQQQTRQQSQPEPQNQQRPPANPIDAMEASLTGKSKDWFSKHRGSIKDERDVNRMIAGHHLAIAERLAPESPEYFEYVEKHMGMNDGGQVAPSRPTPSAPVTRAAPAVQNARNVYKGPIKAEWRRAAEINQMPVEKYIANRAKLVREGVLKEM